MSKIILHRAAERGVTNQGWLHSRHTFSFGDYYHPDRLHFGTLRVINDDMLAPGRGFGNHPHSDMEIVTIPIAGELEHKDGKGEVTTLSPGEIQVLSAGNGMFHNLQNKDRNRSAKYLQLWFIPKLKGVKTRTEKAVYELIENTFIPLITPELHDDTLWIFQDVWMYLNKTTADSQISYPVRDAARNGVYVYVLEGSISINDCRLQAGDGLGIYDFEDEAEVTFMTHEPGKVLLCEVAMKI